jgi:hypothetical protein
VEDKFEAAVVEGDIAQAREVVYGLTEMRQVGANGQASSGEPAPSVTSREWETRQFQEDVANLPDEADDEAYEVLLVVCTPCRRGPKPTGYSWSYLAYKSGRLPATHRILTAVTEEDWPSRRAAPCLPQIQTYQRES